jgi:hypothetical protein
VTVELQVFDDRDGFVLRIVPGDVLWPVLRDAFGDRLPAAGDDGFPSDDFAVDAADVGPIVARLETALRRQRALVAERGPTGGFGEVTVAVLGEEVRVDPRAPDDQVLQRLNTLFVAVQGANAAGLGVRGFVQPQLGSLDHRVAWALRDAPDGIARADLADVLLGLIRELRSAEPSSEEIRDSLDANARAVAEGAPVDDAIARLRGWHLVDEGPDGVLRPTSKLRTVII